MNKKQTLKDPFFFIASLGGIGLIRLAPGTFGSILHGSYLFFYLVFSLRCVNKGQVVTLHQKLINLKIFKEFHKRKQR